MFAQVFFFIISVMVLSLSIFLGLNADNGIFSRIIVVFGGVLFVALQVFVFVILPSFKGDK